MRPDSKRQVSSFFLILSFPVFFSSLSYAVDYDQLASKAKWHKLLHYKKNLFGGYESQADGKDFFLHPEGKTNPVAEITRAIEVFSLNQNPKDDDPGCRFPLRFKWLNQELGFPWRVDLSGCQKYLGFFSKLAAKRATIVFSSYYLNNPNTAFGHTLLRLSRFDDNKETELLDYGINYAAQAHSTNIFSYAWKGLFGGFKGHFTALPYYYKIREYSNYEFRDLWSYDLKLTMPQVLDIVDHIWELGQTDFDYYYFTENCSYHILGLLEVAMPDRNLTDHYHLFAIPADTVRLLKNEGLIKEGRSRESTYTKLLRMSKDLKATDLETSKQILKEPENVSTILLGLDDKKSASILDVTIEAFDYYNAQNILIDHPKTKEKKEYILRERARNPFITGKDVEFQKNLMDSPALSHAPTRFMLSRGYQDQVGSKTQFEIRPALHDLLDPQQGSLKEAQLEVGKTAISLQEYKYHSPHLQLDSLSFFTIKNFPFQNYWASPLSWEIDLGVKQIPRTDCLNCPMAFINGSIGNSFLLGSQFLMAILLNGEGDIQNYFSRDYRFALGPKLYSRIKFSEKFFLGMEAFYHFNTYQVNELMTDHDLFIDIEARHHLTKKLSFMIKGSGRDYKNWSLGGQVGIQYFY